MASVIFRTFVCVCVLLGFISWVSAQSEQGFEVDKPLLYAVVSAGESAHLSLGLLNGAEARDFSINDRADVSFFSVDTRAFSVAPEGSASLGITLGSQALAPGVYVGSLVITTGSEQLTIPVILEVQSRAPLFDVSLRELPSFSTLQPGTLFTPQIVLYNLRSLDNGAELSYALYALNGTRVVEGAQPVTVRSTLELALSVPIPSDIAPGDYVFAVFTRSATSLGTITSVVHVENIALSPSVISPSSLLPYAFGTIVVLLAGFLLVNYLWKRRLVTSTVYWDRQLREARHGSDTHRAYRKLMSQRRLLQEAHRHGYITPSSYKQTLARIDSLGSHLKKRL